MIQLIDGILVVNLHVVKIVLTNNAVPLGLLVMAVVALVLVAKR